MALGRLSASRTTAILTMARTAEPNCGPMGDTLGDDPVTASVNEAQVVGAGSDAFDRAVACLRALVPQRAVAAVSPAEATAELGTTVLMALPIGPITVVALNRVVAVVDEPRRWGFTYGTLPGHVLVGEESFVVEHRVDDAVVVHVVATAHVAVPASRLLRLLLVPVERHFARRYLDVVARAVARLAR